MADHRRMAHENEGNLTQRHVTSIRQVYEEDQGEVRAQSADKKESREVRKQQPETAGEILSILQLRKVGGIKSQIRYECDLCGKSFATETGRATHRNAVHSNSYPTPKHVTIGKRLKPVTEGKQDEVRSQPSDPITQLKAKAVADDKGSEASKQQPETAGETLSILQPRKVGGIKSQKRYECDMCSKSFPTETGRVIHGMMVHSNNDLTQKQATIVKQATEEQQGEAKTQSTEPMKVLKAKSIANKGESEKATTSNSRRGSIKLKYRCNLAKTAMAHHEATVHKKKIPQERQVGATKYRENACESSNKSLALCTNGDNVYLRGMHTRSTPGLFRSTIHVVYNHDGTHRRLGKVRQLGKDSSTTLFTQKQPLPQDQGEVNYDCFFCGKLFSSNNERASHIAVLHRMRKQQPATAGEDLSILHPRKVGGFKSQIRYECDLCGKSFATETGRASHGKAVHSNNDLQQQRATVEVFATKTSFSAHGPVAHGGKGKLPQRMRISKAETEETSAQREKRLLLVRDMCYEMFATENGRPHHRKVGHEKASELNGVWEAASPASTEPYTPVKYKAKTLKSEMIIDQPPLQTNLRYRCTLCNKSFPTVKRLIFHRWMAHISERQLTQCKFCVKLFVSTHAMLLHKRREHTRACGNKGKRQYQCRRCLRTFWSELKLNAHKRIAHKRQTA
eukprot:GHVN01107159.1.p1 GENE.GHVN01107159.1~~GHVN01107159.1.p1  ORF type:complete len:680 (+),score=73.59 GHVN01107159.1:191-2230(+)